MKEWIRLVCVVLACLLAGIGIAWLLLITWLHAPAAHVSTAIWYLVTSGLLSLATGFVVMATVARLAPTLWLKIVIAAVAGSIAAIVNILYTPLLMFAETADKDILVITMLYFLALSLGFAFLIAAFTTRQVHELHEAARRLAAGELGTTVAIQGIDEVADLARTFNAMSAELQRSFERRQQFDRERRDLMVAVSHDLRTPIAAIRAMAEALNDRVITDPATVTRYLKSIQQQTENLGQLVEDLFEVARLESGTLDLRLAAVPIRELVEETVDSVRAQADGQGIELAVSADPALPPLALDAPRMQRALLNLLQNALQHTPAGGRIEVLAQQRHEHVQLSVTDTGEGVAAEDQERIFERFYRGEQSRSRESGGAGLGLAIARGIVEAHHGTIHVESVSGHGARFVVTL